jgi:hypothetical protein
MASSISTSPNTFLFRSELNLKRNFGSQGLQRSRAQEGGGQDRLRGHGSGDRVHDLARHEMGQQDAQCSRMSRWKD